jgi:dTDP-4-dehydrorhamnose 3,5-epimerase
MNISDAPLSGLKLIQPDKFDDSRGYFMKPFEKKVFAQQGIDFNIAQVNHSFNLAKGTLRGLHFQVEPFSQDKLVFCAKGRVFDVAVDLRKSSGTYGNWFGVELSEFNNQVIYIPKGFAHGYETLEDNSEVLYYIDGEYSKENEAGIRWNDPTLAIKWPLEPTVLSDKDRNWPLFAK